LFDWLALGLAAALVLLVVFAAIALRVFADELSRLW